MPADPDGQALFVVASRIHVSDERSQELVDAFRGRSRLVDGVCGFDHLEVWQERRDPTHVVMTSWWESPDVFATYMRSDEHRQSHARIPRGAGGPRGVGITCFDVVAR